MDENEAERCVFFLNFGPNGVTTIRLIMTPEAVHGLKSGKPQFFDVTAAGIPIKCEISWANDRATAQASVDYRSRQDASQAKPLFSGEKK